MSAPDSPLPNDDALTLAGVVHDVNQMLTVISGRAGLLLSQDIEPRWVPHLQAMLLASSDAAAMLRRLSPAGATSPAVGVDLNAVAEEARLLVWPTSADEYVWRNDLVSGLTTTVPGQVLREVLANLLLNTVAVMPTGGQVSLAAEVRETGRLRLSVTDTGPGLPSGDPDRIFEPGVSSSGEQGRGIGLAGCRQLLAAVGGQLSAGQVPGGGGAVFYLDLPEGGPVRAEKEPIPEPVPAMGVLVVDDEAGVREMLGDVLGSWGCRVLTCRDGKSALEAHQTGSLAVAFIDRNLPGINGLELATRLRESDPCLSIVLMTGWQQRESLPAADPAIVDQEAEKPLAIAQIQEILRAGYQRHQLRLENGHEGE